MAGANIKVAQSPFEMATTGKTVAAAILWMKARRGWRGKHKVAVPPTADLPPAADIDLQRIIRQFSAAKPG